jgi:hypothetical protein
MLCGHDGGRSEAYVAALSFCSDQMVPMKHVLNTPMFKQNDFGFEGDA